MKNKLLLLFIMLLCTNLTACKELKNDVSVMSISREEPTILTIQLSIDDLNSKTLSILQEKVVNRLRCTDLNNTETEFFDNFQLWENDTMTYNLKICVDDDDYNSCGNVNFPENVKLECQLAFHNMLFDFNSYRTKSFLISDNQ